MESLVKDAVFDLDLVVHVEFFVGHVEFRGEQRSDRRESSSRTVNEQQKSGGGFAGKTGEKEPCTSGGSDGQARIRG